MTPSRSGRLRHICPRVGLEIDEHDPLIMQCDCKFEGLDGMEVDKIIHDAEWPEEDPIPDKEWIEMEYGEDGKPS